MGWEECYNIWKNGWGRKRKELKLLWEGTLMREQEEREEELRIFGK